MTMTTSKQSGKFRDARAKSKNRKKIRSAARKPALQQMKLPGAGPSAPIATKNKQRSNTKQARVIAMLRAPAGATIDAMVQATGWQQHSVRGFLAGIVRKKLGLNATVKTGCARANQSFIRRGDRASARSQTQGIAGPVAKRDRTGGAPTPIPATSVRNRRLPSPGRGSGRSRRANPAAFEENRIGPVRH